MIGEVAAVGAGFKGAISYLVAGARDDPDPDRVAWMEVRNLASDNPQHAWRLMRATAAQSSRCKKPLYHLVLSWKEDENPTAEMMRAHVDETIRDLELGDHQAFIAAHKDTRHPHVHLLFNRVHPETTKAWDTGNDYRRIEVSIRRQLEARGLPFVPGKFNDPQRFGKTASRVRNGEYQAAVRHGREPSAGKWNADEVARRRAALHPLFDAAGGWEILAEGLAGQGLRLRAKGQGLVVEGADGYMKLSDLSKQVRLAGLEQRYGEAFVTYIARAGQASDDTPPPAVLVSGRDLHEYEKQRLRDEMRRSRRAVHQRKPEGSSADDAPATSLSLDSDPRARAMAALRQARSTYEAARRRVLEGKADRAELSEHALRLDLARAELEQHLAASPPPAPTEGSPSVPREDTPPAEQSRPSTPKPPSMSADVKGSLRHQAFDGLRDARATFDMAWAMHGAGLLSDAQLAAAAREIEAAEDKLTPHLTLDEQLRRDLREVFAEQQRKARVRPSAPQLPSQPRKSRKKGSEDRDR